MSCKTLPCKYFNHMHEQLLSAMHEQDTKLRTGLRTLKRLYGLLDHTIQQQGSCRCYRNIKHVTAALYGLSDCPSRSVPSDYTVLPHCLCNAPSGLTNLLSPFLDSKMSISTYWCIMGWSTNTYIYMYAASQVVCTHCVYLCVHIPQAQLTRVPCSWEG